MRFLLFLFLLLTMNSYAHASDPILAGVVLNKPMSLPDCTPKARDSDTPQTACLVSSLPPDTNGLREGVFTVPGSCPSFIRSRGRIFWFADGVVLIEVRTVQNSRETDIIRFIKDSFGLDEPIQTFDSLHDGPGKGFVWDVFEGNIELKLYSDINEGTIDLRSIDMPVFVD